MKGEIFLFLLDGLRSETLLCAIRHGDYRIQTFRVYPIHHYLVQLTYHFSVNQILLINHVLKIAHHVQQ